MTGQIPLYDQDNLFNSKLYYAGSDPNLDYFENLQNVSLKNTGQVLPANAVQLNLNPPVTITWNNIYTTIYQGVQGSQQLQADAAQGINHVPINFNPDIYFFRVVNPATSDVFSAKPASNWNDPSAWDAFSNHFYTQLRPDMGSWVNYDINYPNVVNSENFKQGFVPPSTNYNSNPLFQAFFNEYKYFITGQYSNATDTSQNLIKDFKDAFYTFIHQIAKPVWVSRYIDTGSNLSNFTTDWRNFLASTAIVGNARTTNAQGQVVYNMSTQETNNGTYLTGNKNLISYENIYKAFFYPGVRDVPDATTMTNLTTDFTTFFNSFRNGEITKYGYFLPSHSLVNFFQAVKDKYIQDVVGAQKDQNTGQVLKVNGQVVKDINATMLTSNGSVITTNDADKVSILFDIFQLLVSMIDSLQKITATQATRLQYLSSYQRVYTDYIAAIPVFTQGDKTVFGGNSDKLPGARSELNALNGSLAENFRSYRSLLQDEAKTVQAAVNQSNESVNQQADMATTILQQFSTILQSIFR